MSGQDTLSQAEIDALLAAVAADPKDQPATYAAGDLAGDFPGGLTADSRLSVAQWGEGYGWGAEAGIPLAG